MRKMNFKSESAKSVANNETKVVCPQCGAEFGIPDQTTIGIGIVIGKDAGLGTIHPEVVGQDNPAEKKEVKLPSKAADRIEALKAAGVDVSGFFSMRGSDGGEYVGRMEDGKMSILSDDDPVYDYILKQGTVPNWKLFRRWVMAQMFYMLSCEVEKKGWCGYYRARSVTDSIRAKGYDYMWKQMEDELYAQYKMDKHGDKENFEDRNLWFNKLLVIDMMNDYIRQLGKVIEKLPQKKCKGVPYKKVDGHNIFLTDIDKKVFLPVRHLIADVKGSRGSYNLWKAVNAFNRIRVRRIYDLKQCSAWIDSYKGAGAFFTLQNMVRFHGCFLWDDKGKKLDKETSYVFLKLKADQYKEEGWRLLGLLRKALKDNGIDIEKKRAEWKKNK